MPYAEYVHQHLARPLSLHTLRPDLQNGETGKTGGKRRLDIVVARIAVHVSSAHPTSTCLGNWVVVDICPRLVT